jgi:hypothetical protein
MGEDGASRFEWGLTGVRHQITIGYKVSDTMPPWLVLALSRTGSGPFCRNAVWGFNETTSISSVTLA